MVYEFKITYWICQWLELFCIGVNSQNVQFPHLIINFIYKTLGFKQAKVINLARGY